MGIRQRSRSPARTIRKRASRWQRPRTAAVTDSEVADSGAGETATAVHAAYRMRQVLGGTDLGGSFLFTAVLVAFTRVMWTSNMRRYSGASA